jgi:hypothetical protein
MGQNSHPTLAPEAKSCGGCRADDARRALAPQAGVRRPIFFRALTSRRRCSNNMRILIRTLASAPRKGVAEFNMLIRRVFASNLAQRLAILGLDHPSDWFAETAIARARGCTIENERASSLGQARPERRIWLRRRLGVASPSYHNLGVQSAEYASV